MLKGVFVTGTDTGVGKTLVAAWLVRNLGAEYWKPVQTGAAGDDDSATIRRLSPETRIHPPSYVFQAPLSPHDAARRERVRIDLSAIIPPVTANPLVIEGAGGVMVPLNEMALVIDLIERLGLPALVVARTALGTINHTVMTLEMLRRRRVPILGVVLNGQKNPANRQAIEHFGAVPILAEFQPLPAVTASVLAGLPPPAFAIA